MIANRTPPKLLRLDDGMLLFSRADQSGYCNLDLSQHDKATLAKIGFAIDALNRWNAFVDSVGQVDELICEYEKATSPKFGASNE